MSILPFSCIAIAAMNLRTNVGGCFQQGDLRVDARYNLPDNLGKLSATLKKNADFIRATFSTTRRVVGTLERISSHPGGQRPRSFPLFRPSASLTNDAHFMFPLQTRWWPPRLSPSATASWPSPPPSATRSASSRSSSSRYGYVRSVIPLCSDISASEGQKSLSPARSHRKRMVLLGNRCIWLILFLFVHMLRLMWGTGHPSRQDRRRALP